MTFQLWKCLQIETQVELESISFCGFGSIRDQARIGFFMDKKRYRESFLKRFVEVKTNRKAIDTILDISGGYAEGEKNMRKSER